MFRIEPRDRQGHPRSYRVGAAAKGVENPRRCWDPIGQRDAHLVGQPTPPGGLSPASARASPALSKKRSEDNTRSPHSRDAHDPVETVVPDIQSRESGSQVGDHGRARPVDQIQNTLHSRWTQSPGRVEDNSGSLLGGDARTRNPPGGAKRSLSRSGYPRCRTSRLSDVPQDRDAVGPTRGSLGRSQYSD